MCTSDKALRRHLLGQLAATAFLALFGAVYEAFSHGVYSYCMIYAFALPLALGVIPYTLLLLSGRRPGSLFLRLLSSAIAVFSVGSVMAGVLAIYGTTNALLTVYPIAGAALTAAALGTLIRHKAAS